MLDVGRNFRDGRVFYMSRETDNALLVNRIDVPQDRHIVHVQLNRPQAKNAMTFEMAGQFRELTADLASDSSVAAVVVSGVDGSFCSGGDLSWLGDGASTPVSELRSRMRYFYESFLSLSDINVPTIAAVDGPAIGAGMAFASSADLRVVAECAKVGVPFTHLGLHPGMASTFTLPQLVGKTMAQDLFLTGRILSGQECLDSGFASRLTETGGAVEEGLRMARRVAGAAPIATELTLKTLRSAATSRQQAVEWEALAQPVTMQTADAVRGLKAAAAKERPVFEGS